MTEDLLSGAGNTVPKIDPDKDYLAELVGEGKKFKTPLDMARGKVEADNFIEALKREKEELRTEYLKIKDEAASRAKLEDLIDQLSKAQRPASSEHTPANVDNQPKFDPTQLESLVANEYQKNKKLEKEQANFRMVQDKLKEKYGDNFATVLQTQMEDLDLTAEQVNTLARTSPKAFFNTMELNEARKDQFQSPVNSSTRSNAFQQKGSQKRTWQYYQDMKQKNPNLYLDPKTNLQMYKDHQELGSAFEDGDFHRFD